MCTECMRRQWAQANYNRIPQMVAATAKGIKPNAGVLLPVTVVVAAIDNVLELRPHCPACSVRGLCLPLGLHEHALHKLYAIIHLRMRVRRKETLYRPGEHFASLYAIRLGTF